MIGSKTIRAAFSAKYRSLTLSLLVFLVIMLLLMTLNYLISKQIDQDALRVDLAGRQRAVSQRIVKSLLEILNDRNSGRSIVAPQNDLIGSFYLFDSTMDAFKLGGAVPAGKDENETENMEAITYKRPLEIVDTTLEVWGVFKDYLIPVVTKGDAVSDEELSAAINFGVLRNQQIYAMMRELSFELQNAARTKAQKLNYIQWAGMAIAPVYCLTMVFYFIRKLRLSDEEIERYTEGLQKLTDDLQTAKNETDNILGSVNEGLFLLDEKFNIGNQYSDACKKIFDMEDLGGQSFMKLFRKLVPAKTYDTAKKYMNLLFKAHIEEATLAKFNPFHELEINFDDGKGGFQTKFLDFRFNRIFEGKEVRLTMVTVSDVTDRVNLEKQLKKTEEETQKQMEMMLDILHSDVTMLEDFMDGSEEELNKIKVLLKGDQKEITKGGEEKTTEYRQILDAIFRSMHTIKGNASMIKLKFFETKAHAFEEKIVSLKNKPTLTGNDFLPITLALSEMFEDIGEIRELIGKLANLTKTGPLSPGARKEPSANSDHGLSMVEMIDGLVLDLSRKQGKELAFACSEFDENTIPEKYKKPLRDILIQLVRNSITHGIERPDERLGSAKYPQGRLQIKVDTNGQPGKLHITVRDDGRGLLPSKLTQKALEMKKWSKDEIRNWDLDKLNQLIFEPGFSTADEVTTDAGRGIGMDIVKEIVEKHGGSIYVDSMPGEYCQFELVLPS